MTCGAFNGHGCTFSVLRGLGCWGACTQRWLGSTGLAEDIGFPPGGHSLHLRNIVAILIVLNLNHHFPLEQKQQEQGAVTELISKGSRVDLRGSPLHPGPSLGPTQAHPQMSPSVCDSSLQDPRAGGTRVSQLKGSGSTRGELGVWLRFPPLGKHL